MIAKAGLVVIGLGAISVGGVALTKPYWLGMADPMPEYHTLKEDNDFASSYNNGETKFGKKYGRYLVGVNTKSGGSKKNEDWWDWAYRRLRNEKPQPGKFKSVDKGYGNTDNHLSKVCKDAYETEESSFNDTGSTNFKKSEVWKYCSIGGTQPQTIKEFTSGDNAGQETYEATDAIGSDSNKKATLLSIKSPVNDWIWDLKNEDFFSNSTTISENNYFQSEKAKTGEQRNSIKKICEEAYKKKENSQGTGAEKITKADTEKYCSLTGSSN